MVCVCIYIHTPIFLAMTVYIYKSLSHIHGIYIKYYSQDKIPTDSKNSFLMFLAMTVYIYTVMAKNIGTLGKYDQRRL